MLDGSKWRKKCENKRRRELFCCKTSKHDTEDTGTQIMILYSRVSIIDFAFGLLLLFVFRFVIIKKLKNMEREKKYKLVISRIFSLVC